MYIDNAQGGDEDTAPAMAAAGAPAGAWSNILQTGNANGADWQEEVYQKIKSMKEIYFSKLNDLYQKMAYKMQQHDSHRQRLQNEQIEKLKMFKMTLERIMLILQLNKHDIQLIHKDKLPSVEKFISFFLSGNWPRKPTSSQLQEQLPQSSVQLQQPQSLDGQTNPSMQPVQGSMEAIQQNNLTNLQHNSLSGVSTISNSQRHIINIVKPGSRLDLGQVATSSLQQNPVNSPQQDSICSFSSQSGKNPVQENLGSLQRNSNALQQLFPKQHEQQMLQNQQLTHQLLMQQQLFQNQQLMKHQQPMNSLQQLMQQNNLTNLQHNSLSGVSTIFNSRQQMKNTVQPGNSLNSLQQVVTGSLQQNPVNSPQQVNISSLSSQSGTIPVQANLGSLQKNSSVLQQMSQSQQMLQNQQQMQQLLFQRQQLMQLQQMGMKTGVLHQQQSFGQRVGFNHPQLKSGISSPQLHQALSPQVIQHLSPQIDQQNMLAYLSKAGTPLQSASSPFVVPSPSTPLAPSPMPGDSEKVSAGLASHTTAGNIMHQQATLPMEFEPYTSTVEAPLDSSAQTGNANEADWQEEIYQKIKSMREMHLSELNDLYWKIASTMQQSPQHEKIEKLKIFKMTLERIVLFLRLNKHEIQLSHKGKLFSLEKHISFFLSGKRPHKPTSSPLQGQLPQPSIHTSQAQNTYAHQPPTMDSDVQDIASKFDRLLSLTG